jgi:hypothetical protein
VSDPLAALTKHLEQMEKDAGIVRVPAPRDWVPCQWCGGSSAFYDKGCVSCFNAREQRKRDLDAEYKRQFPDGPKPFFTADMDKPEEMEQLKTIFHREAIEKAFGPGGGGVEEVVAAGMWQQELRRLREQERGEDLASRLDDGFEMLADDDDQEEPSPFGTDVGAWR